MSKPEFGSENYYKELVCELCRQFFHAGWVTGTGGSISIRKDDKIFMTPSGVQKERIQPDELFVVDLSGAVISKPNSKPGFSCPKLSDCAPLFLHAYQQRNAGAVLHSHGISCNVITSLCEGKSEFRISKQEMIKGIVGHGYFDELVIPIIENTAWEHELADSLGDAIRNYPKACAVLVRRHGMYVWGDTWEQAKRHGECLHYLFDIHIEMIKLGLTSGPQRKRRRTLAYSRYLCDIEGTTTPITFVKDCLFPYAQKNVRTFLERTWNDDQTSGDVEALMKQASEDLANGGCENVLSILQSIVSGKLAKTEMLDALEKYVADCITKDRKIGALKQLQGHMWDEGYKKGHLKSVVYPDVNEFFHHATEQDAKLYIYSSGSRHAQRLLFEFSDHGDLRPLLSSYFDTTVGNKREAKSYREIVQSLGCDASEILFLTDILEEAQAAVTAGLHATLVVRPGNAPLPDDHGIPVISSFEELM